MIQKFGPLPRMHMETNYHVCTWTQNQQSQSIVRTAQHEAQLVLHCRLQCDETFNMASSALHDCGFSLPKDQSYHSCEVRMERYGKRSMHTCHHWYRGVDMAILVLDLGIGWRREVVTPHTANLPPGKRPGMHCRGD